MDEIRRLKKDPNSSSSKPNNPPVLGNQSASSSETKGSGRKSTPTLNIQPILETQIKVTSKLSPIINGDQNGKDFSDSMETGEFNVEFAYDKVREIIEDQRKGKAKQKIDFMIMVANRLEVSFIDLLHLLPSKSLACLFKDYKQQENALVGLMLPQNGFLTTPKSVFQEQGNQSEFTNEYIAEHTNTNKLLSNDHEQLEEGLTLQDRMRMFFSKHVIPQSLHQMIDFNLDPKKQMEDILGKLEETFTTTSSQTGSQRNNLLGTKSEARNGTLPNRSPGDNISSQESALSGNIQSQASDNIFNEKVFVTNLRQFSGSLHCFMEKIYRKHSQKAEILLQNLQRISNLNSEFEIDPLLLDYNSLKRDRGVLYRLAMSGTKKLLFYYMQDRTILTKCALSYIFKFKKKEVFLDYYKHFLSPSGDAPDETIFRISANLENYCKALQTSLHPACALRQAITLIRFLTPLLDTFAPQFTSSSTYRYLLRALCWRVVRFILFIQNGDLSYVALAFLSFCYNVLFSERSLFYLERDRFIQLLLAFLYLFRNRQDEFFQKSKEIATKILKKLLKTVSQPMIPAIATQISQQRNLSKRKSGNANEDDTSSNISSSSLLVQQSCTHREFWQLHYNYPPLDKMMEEKQRGQYESQTSQQFSIINQELRQIQEQPLIDEQLLLILAYLKNLLLREPYEEKFEIFPVEVLEKWQAQNLSRNELERQKFTFIEQQLTQIRRSKSDIFLHLLSLTRLSDNKKILARSPLAINQLVKLKQELLVDCLGLIGPLNQQEDYLLNPQHSCKWQSDFFPVDLTASELKERIKAFLNINVFNTDIPLTSLCVCREYVDSKFISKRKKLNERLENISIETIDQTMQEESTGLNSSFQFQSNLHMLNNSSSAGNTLNNTTTLQGVNTGSSPNQINYNINNSKLLLQQQQQSSFSLMQWLVELILKIHKQDEVLKIIEGCTELMSNSDLGESLVPSIIFKYLNAVENSHTEIVPVFSRVLEEGHQNHKLIIAKSIIILDKWFRKELKEVKQHNYEPSKPQSILHLDKPYNRFLRNYAYIKKDIPVSLYCRTLVEMSEHKRAIHSLEMEIEQYEIHGLTLADQAEINQNRHKITQLVYQLYNIYKEVNEDYKNIDPFEMMKKLQLEDAEIKKYQEQNMKLKSDGLCTEIYEGIVDRPFRDEDAQLKMLGLLSRSIPDFSQQNLDYAFSKYLRVICYGFQKILSFEKSNCYDNIYYHLKSALQRLKYAFSLQLVYARTSYESKFSTLVKIQVILNIENLLKILKFLKDHNAYCHDIKLASQLFFDSQTFSMEDSQQDFILKLTPISNNNSDIKPNKKLNFLKIIQILAKRCIKPIIESLQSLQLSYDQENYLRVVYKYLICVIFTQCNELRSSFILSLLKFSQFCYKTGKYQDAQVNIKKAKSIWKGQKECFKGQELYMIQAKIEKKLGHIKKAMDKLSKVNTVESRIKRVTYKYQHNFKLFSETLIYQEFQMLLKEVKESEKLHFKYAKFLDSNFLISDNPDEKEIDFKVRAIKAYLLAARFGHQYIHQSLPRAIRLLVELCSDIHLIPNAEQLQLNIVLENTFLYATKVGQEIEPFKLAGVINQLTSHITTTYQICAKLFIDLLAKVGAVYPLQSVWWLLPLKFMYRLIGSQTKVQKDSYTEERAAKIFQKIGAINKESYNIINQIIPFYSNLLDFAIRTPDSSTQTVKLEQFLQQNLKKFGLILPQKEFIFPQMPDKNIEVSYDYNPYPENPVYMERIRDNVRVMSSKQKPKLICVSCSDGQERRFLIKSQAQNENAYEQRTSELISFLNLLLSQENLQLYEMPTYSIIRLNSQSCLVEWVDDTVTIKTILEQLWTDKKQKSRFQHLKIDGDKIHAEEWARQKRLPSVMQDFFNQRFLDSSNWYQAKDNYVKTYASWCVLGYILGLGDRHTDNILIKTQSGEIVHIDYALIFGSGKQLNVPETIPFRLTKNMEFALGAFKSQGIFRKAMIDICLCFSKHIDDIMGFWNCFASDLNGGRKSTFNQLCNQIKSRIKLTNFKSTEEGIDSLIEISKDDYCLRDMFKGWWPHA